MGKKFYWIKLQNDFFKRHDIQILEGMPHGKEYLLLYLKLLVESVDHYGHLRFNDNIPYSDEMLATVTRTNLEITRKAIKMFCKLGLISVLDDKTMFMNELEKMVGCEGEWAEKKRLYRETRTKKGHCPKNVQDESGQCPPDVPAKSNKSIEIETEIETEIELDTEIDLGYASLYKRFPLFAKRYWMKASSYHKNEIVIAQKANAWILEEILEGKMIPNVCSLMTLDEFTYWARNVMPYVNPDEQCVIDAMRAKLLYGDGV